MLAVTTFTTIAFSEISSVDKLSEMAVACDVAGFVTMQSRTPWVPGNIRSRERGLVPTLQSMRLDIAMVLKERWSERAKRVEDERSRLATERAKKVVTQARAISDIETFLNNCGIVPSNSKDYAETLVVDHHLNSAKQLAKAVLTGQYVSIGVLSTLLGDNDLEMMQESNFVNRFIERF